MQYIKRIPTGINGLDEMLEGGYPYGEGVLITGIQGTGKTIAGLHFIEQACRDARRCVFIATEEMPDKLIKQGDMFGFDLRAHIENGYLRVKRVLETRTNYVRNKTGKRYDPQIKEIDLMDVLDYIPYGTEVVVIDNLGVFALDMEPKEFRDKLDTLMDILSEKQCTSLFILDEASNQLTGTIANYSLCGSINLMLREDYDSMTIERLLRVQKMRRTNIPLVIKKFSIGPEGIILDN